MDDNFYDFSAEKLWLTRFMPIEDSINRIELNLSNVISSIDGISIKDAKNLFEKFSDEGLDSIEDIIQSIEGDFEESDGGLARLWGKVKDEVGELADVATDLISNENSVEAIKDKEFELNQLLNLKSISGSLRLFMINTLLPAVKQALQSESRHSSTGLIRACLQHVVEDVQIIERAINQRSWQYTADGRKQMGPQARALLIVDKLVNMALTPALSLVEHNSPTGAISPITFFSKHTHIHHTPYRNDLLLIGISSDHIMLGANKNTERSLFPEIAKAYLDDPLPSFELFAIPHEVGHYVYQHGKLGGQSIFESWAQIFDRHELDGWREEIFADVYSCMVAGPLAVLSVQAIIATSLNESVCTNDGEHPLGTIRPFMMSNFLRLLRQEGAKLGSSKYAFEHEFLTQLDENWKNQLRLKGINHQEDVPSPPKEAVNFFVELSQAINFGEDELTSIPWFKANHSNLNLYNQDMEAFIQKAFDAKEWTNATLAPEPSNTPQDLNMLLMGWDDDWNTGGGSSGGRI